MSLKQEIETWVAALSYYDNNDFQESLNAFSLIADTSKILFNCGIIHATLGEHERAVKYYQLAVAKDQYMAISYFQEGVSNFLMGDFEEALANFNDTLLYLRGNNNIDYEQLGLKYKLYSCEALFNRGLCYIYLQQTQTGMIDLDFASKEKATQDHDVIDDAIREKAEGYTVFSIPVGLVFRPSEAKVKNVQVRNYLGKARLVMQHDPNQPTHRRNVSMDSWAKDDRPRENISYAATNMVRTNLPSRTRQHSEPPVNRNRFPPTPPPEVERQPTTAQVDTDRLHPAERSQSTGRSRSASRTRKPSKLDLGVAAFEQPSTERQRPGTRRTASERPIRHLRSKISSPKSDTQQSPRSPRAGQGKDLFGAIDNQTGFDAGLVSPHYHRHISSPKTQTSPAAASRPQYNRQHSIAEDEEPNSPSMHRVPPSASSSTFSYGIDSPPPKSQQQPQQQPQYQRRPPQRRPSAASAGSQPQLQAQYQNLPSPTKVRKVRVKVHVGEDTRYLIVTTDIRFADFTEQVRAKFGFKGACKIRSPDEEGDMITMGDQEDLEMAMQAAKDVARGERVDMGKFEVWVQEL